MFIKEYKSLYRAKSIKDGEWVEGFYCRVGYTNQEKDYIIPSYASAFYGIEIDAKTLCPSFMYKDNSGRTIYDKDIVQFKTNSGYIDDTYLIQWIDEGQEFVATPLHPEEDGLIGSVDTYFHDYKYPNCPFSDFIPMVQDIWGDFNPDYGGGIYIIGNAFDNPELLNATEMKGMSRCDGEDL